MRLGRKTVTLNQMVPLGIFEEFEGIKLRQSNCPGCGSADVSIFYNLRQVPVHSVLLMTTRQMAINYPKGNITLGFCHNCGFISNFDFAPDLLEYCPKYEETQGFSPTFNFFHRRLANYLVTKYDLYEKDILEIGCGKGEFLALICRLGNNRAVGFDPAYDKGRWQNHGAGKEKVTFIRDFFCEKYAHYKADFICCKMTLEHIYRTSDFMNMVRDSVADRADTVVFFQIPEAGRILREIAFWDIYYEHCSYFAPASLYRLFVSCGFDVLNIWTDYNDQYLMIEAMTGDNRISLPNDVEQSRHRMAESVSFFAENYQSRLEKWKRYLNDLHRNRQKIVLWGSGSKAVSFLTTLKINKQIEYVVDINPFRWNSFIAGTGHKIVCPDFLRAYKPDAVVVMNPVYTEEIRRLLADMGLRPHLNTVLM